MNIPIFISVTADTGVSGVGSECDINVCDIRSIGECWITFTNGDILEVAHTRLELRKMIKAAIVDATKYAPTIGKKK